ncbi:hypothetical protein GH714_012236 [Hevea brasiliensis]|uniref:Uncharacterized protein n=1 Tax=Hevea brasiliensis TaxID=3981 RepID=A0A6A6LJY3_HEVBR|nr:hypothetical protein GH714_012236 [Hevea brasiliensis]
MPQERFEPVSILLPRNLSKRRSFRSRVDRDDRGWTLLHIGARKGDLKEAQRYFGLYWKKLVQSSRINQGDPLHLAAEGGHLEVMDELLERGADIDARTWGACGWTPLHSAAKKGRRKQSNSLLRMGRSCRMT